MRRQAGARGGERDGKSSSEGGVDETAKLVEEAESDDDQGVDAEPPAIGSTEIAVEPVQIVSQVEETVESVVEAVPTEQSAAGEVAAPASPPSQQIITADDAPTPDTVEFHLN